MSTRENIRLITRAPLTNLDLPPLISTEIDVLGYFLFEQIRKANISL